MKSKQHTDTNHVAKLDGVFSASKHITFIALNICTTGEFKVSSNVWSFLSTGLVTVLHTSNVFVFVNLLKGSELTRKLADLLSEKEGNSNFATKVKIVRVRTWWLNKSARELLHNRKILT